MKKGRSIVALRRKAPERGPNAGGWSNPLKKTGKAPLPPDGGGEGRGKKKRIPGTHFKIKRYTPKEGNGSKKKSSSEKKSRTLASAMTVRVKEGAVSRRDLQETALRPLSSLGKRDSGYLRPGSGKNHSSKGGKSRRSPRENHSVACRSMSLIIAGRGSVVGSGRKTLRKKKLMLNLRERKKSYSRMIVETKQPFEKKEDGKRDGKDLSHKKKNRATIDDLGNAISTY